MNEFRSIGFYICPVKTIKIFEWNKSGKMLSVSPCFNDIEPMIEVNDYFRGWFEDDNRHKADKENHRKSMGLNSTEYSEFLTLIHKLCGEDRTIDVDGRFSRFSDAKNIFDRYFKKLGYKLVSVSTTDKYFEAFAAEHSYSRIKKGWELCGEPDNSKLLGYDILGWDFDRFHTFMCNMLYEELPKARFNELCLLENDFSEVEKFAEDIADLGEPVDWLPFRIGEVV